MFHYYARQGYVVVVVVVVYLFIYLLNFAHQYKSCVKILAGPPMLGS